MVSPHWHLARAQLRSQTEYRTSFAIETVLNGVLTGIDLLGILVFFQVNPAFGGFALAEALLITGLAGLGFALADLAVGNVERLPVYIRTGRLDAVLLRPLGALSQLVVGDIALRRLGRTVQAFVVLVVALGMLDITWTPAKVALLVVTPLAGAVVFGCVFVSCAAVSFWLVESSEVANAFTYGGHMFASFPSTVFSGWFRGLFAYALGLGFVAYLPALALLGRPDPLGLPEWLRWCAPLVALAWVLVARIVWRAGLRRYGSTGS